MRVKLARRYVHVRLIVTVDEDKCTGCGRCVKACLTGALQLVKGKSRLY